MKGHPTPSTPAEAQAAVDGLYDVYWGIVDGTSRWPYLYDDNPLSEYARRIREMEDLRDKLIRQPYEEYSRAFADVYQYPLRVIPRGKPSDAHEKGFGMGGFIGGTGGVIAGDEESGLGELLPNSGGGNGSKGNPQGGGNGSPLNLYGGGTSGNEPRSRESNRDDSPQSSGGTGHETQPEKAKGGDDKKAGDRSNGNSDAKGDNKKAGDSKSRTYWKSDSVKSDQSSGQRKRDNSDSDDEGEGTNSNSNVTEERDLPSDPESRQGGKNGGNDMPGRRIPKGSRDNRSGLEQMSQPKNSGKKQIAPDDRERPFGNTTDSSSNQQSANHGDLKGDVGVRRHMGNGGARGEVPGFAERVWWFIWGDRAQPREKNVP
jgi:hypothetical protein